MENKPRKSKAFIITFIIVMVLLFIGYLLFKNSGTSTTKSSTGLSKIFAPLLGTSKEKNLTPVENTGNGTGTGTNTGTINPNDGTTTGGINQGGLGDGSGSIGSDGLGSGSLNGGGGLNTSNLKPLPTPKTNTNITTTTNTSGTAAGQTTTLESTPTTPGVKESLCPINDPLSNYFTPEEKDLLAGYLRQFYLIAPTIRTADDILITNNEILENESFSGQLTSLIKDCNEQKADPAYTGRQEIKSNPYFPAGVGVSTYLPGQTPKTTDQTYSIFEKLLYIW